MSEGLRLANESDADRSIEVISTVKDFLEQAAPLCEVVAILAMRKDGTQFLRISNASAHEKAFLLAFFQAYMTNWFELDHENAKW